MYESGPWNQYAWKSPVPGSGTSAFWGSLTSPATTPSLVLLHGLAVDPSRYYSAVLPVESKIKNWIGIDFPGHGNTPNDSHADIPVLLANVKGILDAARIKYPVFVAHSLGGVIPLLLARAGVPISGFVNIEGNMAGEDCGFVSRRIATHTLEELNQILVPEIVEMFAASSFCGDNLFAKSFPQMDQKTLRSLSVSTVDFSDTAGLLDEFLKLSAPKMFIHGDANSGLSYLPMLKQQMPVFPVPRSGHFPFWDNPKAFMQILNEFLGGLQGGL